MTEYIDLDTPLELKVVWGQTYKPYTSTLRELLDVNRIPYTVADVRPVVRGRWIMNDECKTVCSLCGNVVAFVSHPDRRWDFGNFCPNCGAGMREKT